MRIRPITQSDWSAIMTIQAQTYHAIYPEPLNVMQSKWLLSPDTCLVVELDTEVVGYCLAHPWLGEPPSLNQCLPTELDNPETLYLHDMAFAQAVRGLGAGKALLGRLIAHAKQLGVPHLSLVAVQGAESFWEKQGFEHTDTTTSLGSYCDNPSYMRLAL